jgi:hypothetical protein
MVWTQLINQWVGQYQSYPIGKTELVNHYGSITWIKDDKFMEKIIVYEIYINPEFRSQGFCKEFLTQLIDIVGQTNAKQIQIQAVLSPILYNFLLRFKYQGKKFKIIKGEWTYLI